MNTCRTCRFWRSGVCDLITYQDEKVKPHEAVIAVTVADDHNLNAELRTGPDFGCTLHEPSAGVARG